MRTSNFRPILLVFATLQIGIQLLEPLHDLFHLAKPRLQLSITECKKQLLDESSDDHDPKFAICDKRRLLHTGDSLVLVYER